MTLSLDYSFLAPSRIAFGWGVRGKIAELIRPFGERAIVVSGSRTLAANGTLERVYATLRAAGISVVTLAAATREPCVEDVDRATATLQSLPLREGDFVLAIGGGSAIDLGKAVAALAPNEPGVSVVEYLEGVGSGRTLSRPPLPVVAMPTTSGTGSEATKNAVISSTEPTFKKSLRSDAMMPQLAVVDPELAVSAPRGVTIACGMDAITQLIESAISRFAKPIPQALALQGVGLALPAIIQAAADPTHRPAREALAHAALLSGMALANSGLGMAHGVAAALGVHFAVPHGLACAMMLPVALRANRGECQQAYAGLNAATDPRLHASESAAADAFVEHVEQLCLDLGIPQRLGEFGVCASDLSTLAVASRGNSMNGNPRFFNENELRAILEEVL
jgi:alcohol dehydrogenase class IV